MIDNKQIIPVFYDHSSQKSSLTWWSEKECKEGGPVSILTLAKEIGLKKIFFVSKNFHSFNEARKACEDNNLQLCFGLELWITDNIEKSEQSTHNESKVIVWAKNSRSYKDLIQLYSKIYTNINNKYYHFRGDYKILNEMWTKNLMLSLPFYDSCIARNLLHNGSAIIPNFPCKPIIQREIGGELPFDDLINEALNNYNVNNELEEINTKTIFYNKREDIKSVTVYRSIAERSNYGAPGLDYFCSDTFSFENYKEVSK